VNERRCRQSVAATRRPLTRPLAAAADRVLPSTHSLTHSQLGATHCSSTLRRRCFHAACTPASLRRSLIFPGRGTTPAPAFFSRSRLKSVFVWRRLHARLDLAVCRNSTHIQNAAAKFCHNVVGCDERACSLVCLSASVSPELYVTNTNFT